MEKKNLLLISGLLIFLVLVTTITFKSVRQDEENTPAIPPAKIGTIKSSLQTYDFNDAVAYADLIVKVQIKSVMKELHEPSPKTLFNAATIETYKQDENLSSNYIKILQAGNSSWLYEGSPQFNENDQYVLFLKKAVGMEESDIYWILGEETGMYEVLRNGKLKKVAKSDAELNNIEDKQFTQNLQEMTAQTGIESEVQVIYELGFKDKIDRLLTK